MDTYTKEKLERCVLYVLEASSSLCLGEPDDRLALADALTVDVLGCFNLQAKPESETFTVFAFLKEAMEGKQK